MRWDAFLHPVGPRRPAVYWRRRAVVLAVLVVVLVFALRAIASDGPKAPGSPQAVGARTAAPSGGPSPSGSRGASPSRSPTAGTARATTTHSPPATATSPAGPACDKAQLRVIASADAASYEPTALPVLTVRVVNQGSACAVDLGAPGTSVGVAAGGKQVWSSGMCVPRGPRPVRITAGGEERVQVRWNRMPAADGCPSPGEGAGSPGVGAGTYQVIAVSGGITAYGGTIVLRGSGHA